MNRAINCIFVLLTATISISVHAAPITINSTFTYTRTNGADGTVTDTDTTAVFGSRSLLAESGSNLSSMDFKLVDAGSSALFDFDMTHVRDDGLASSSFSRIRFTANADTSYLLDGRYGVGAISTAGKVLNSAHLLNITTDTVLFEQIQHSEYNTNQSFLLPGDVGDTFHYIAGFHFGDLVAGNEYEFSFVNITESRSWQGDEGALGGGCVTMYIGDALDYSRPPGHCVYDPYVSSVPEPMPLTLLSAGIIILGLRRRCPKVTHNLTT